VKNQGNGQARILSTSELKRLFCELKTPRDRCLFAICLFTACRISEALALSTTDIRGGNIVFRKATTKGRLRTRSMAIHPELKRFLQEYKPPKRPGLMFPPGHLGGDNKHLCRARADKIFRDACARAEIEGASTHSFRRTALSMMSSAGVPLRTIQEISGHADLGTLQRYLEVSPDEVKAAIEVIHFK
jgi:integrase/recombinase XerD